MYTDKYVKRGRDPQLKCDICGQYIAYKDIPDNVSSIYIPDTEFTFEQTTFTHKKCESKNETIIRNGQSSSDRLCRKSFT